MKELKVEGQHQFRIKLFDWEIIITLCNWKKIRQWGKENDIKFKTINDLEK